VRSRGARRRPRAGAEHPRPGTGPEHQRANARGRYPPHPKEFGWCTTWPGRRARGAQEELLEHIGTSTPTRYANGESPHEQPAAEAEPKVSKTSSSRPSAEGLRALGCTCRSSKDRPFRLTVWYSSLLLVFGVAFVVALNLPCGWTSQTSFCAATRSTNWSGSQSGTGLARRSADSPP